MTYTAATRAALAHALAAPDVVLVSETAGLPCSFTEGLEGRLIAVPAGDRGTTAFAIGLAVAGQRVVLELPSAAHLAKVADELAEAAQLAGTEHRLTVVVTVAYGGELPPFDRPLGRALPPTAGLQVVCASSPELAAGLLLHGLERTGVTVVLQPRALGRSRAQVSMEARAPAPSVIREGSHITLAAWGAGVDAALDAAEALARDGISAGVVDLVALQPLDLDLLGAQVRHTGRLVVAHPEDEVLAAQVRSVGLDAAFLHLESPLAQVEAESSRIARAARDAVHY